MNKYGLFLLLSFVCTFGVYSQDLIVNQHNDSIFCKILDINDENIKYQVQNEGVITTNTLSRKNVKAYSTNEYYATTNPAEAKKEANSSFRIAVVGGYAYKLGKVLLTGDHKLDDMSKELKNAYVLDAELQYFFNYKYGIALNINSNNAFTSGNNVNMPNFGSVSNYKENQRITFVGPAFATRHDARKWLFTGSIGLGALLFNNRINMDERVLNASQTSFGMYAGFGGEYKLSNHWGLGLKLGYTLGSIKSLNVNGQNVKFDEVMSLSSFFVAAGLSFRTR